MRDGGDNMSSAAAHCLRAPSHNNGIDESAAFTYTSLILRQFSIQQDLYFCVTQMDDVVQ